MEKATLDIIIKRIDRLEQVVANMNWHLSLLVKELVPNASENCKTSEELTQTDIKNDKRDAYIARKIFAEIYEKMGISPDFDLRPLEELRESMRQHGIRAEDNEFSRAIIEERENIGG